MDYSAILIGLLLAANLVGIVVNGRRLALLHRAERRNARDIEDLVARLDGRPRNPFPYQEG